MTQTREEFSQSRVADLSRQISELGSFSDLENLSVFAAGSYGRLEAGHHSDIDLFFVYSGAPAKGGRARTEERFFRQLREIAREMDFPEFSSNGRYLRTHELRDVIKRLGGRKDDWANHFTTRMLLLLESRPVGRVEVYDSIMDAIVDEYARDAQNHVDDFHAHFLINDIRRFWTTLLVNYENNRNAPEKRLQKVEQRVKNYKLGISRLTTCFATVAAIESMPQLAPDEIRRLLRQVPRERLSVVASNLNETSPMIEEMSTIYDHFLSLTARSKEDIEAVFASEASRQQEKETAKRYGDLMFEVLQSIGDYTLETRGYYLPRYLAI